MEPGNPVETAIDKLARLPISPITPTEFTAESPAGSYWAIKVTWPSIEEIEEVRYQSMFMKYQLDRRDKGDGWWISSLLRRTLHEIDKDGFVHVIYYAAARQKKRKRNAAA